MKNITERFVNHPSYLRNGAKTLAKSWKCSEADVILAREEARIIIGKPKKSGGNPEAFKDKLKSKSPFPPLPLIQFYAFPISSMPQHFSYALLFQARTTAKIP